MDPVVDEMDAGLADGPVPSSAFASGEFVGRAVHAHEEDVECGEHHGKLLAPLRMFDDVVDDQVIARRCHRANAAMKAIEEPRSHPPDPVEGVSCDRRGTAPPSIS